VAFSLAQAKNDAAVMTRWDQLFGAFEYCPEVLAQRLGVEPPGQQPTDRELLKVLALPLKANTVSEKPDQPEGCSRRRLARHDLRGTKRARMSAAGPRSTLTPNPGYCLKVQMPQDFVKIAHRGELPPGKMKRLDLNGRRILLANVDGSYYATDDTCTHEDASLSTGFLKGAVVKCPLHGSRFNLCTGAVLDDPADENLRTYVVQLDGEDILIRLE
jgi:3-phenylpropionate/trans-cinnamate dioxygenase ferredoxin subunit